MSSLRINPSRPGPEGEGAVGDRLEHYDLEHDIAIVGMAGRFPGASDVDAFWRNLRAGVESITFFPREELEAAGVPAGVLSAEAFVRAAPVLDGIESFDAGFFGYSPREAALLDPQQRIFLECAWEALENAGHTPDDFNGLIGVYGGMSLSTYLLFHLLNHPRLDQRRDAFQMMIGSDKDFLTTRVSYHLDLKGPSLDVQTGCSTSLVATHLACESLLGFQCDLALAGGVSVQVPQRWGYFYEEGGITSPDGHCRAFDADGEGTLFGSGVGIVVLRRLADAVEDGDRIEAVIRGSAVNNDGSAKIGFTAPGVEGQAEVIARAQAIAGVEPEAVSYVEAHGTGTPLGDPVEVSALERAFATERQGSCGLGSVKTNIGHLDAAAGVAGLIKTALALRHRQLPPSLHFKTPNPKIDFETSPFYVVDRLRDWPRTGTPKVAGVSSFGIGGTNAHVILQEAPEPIDGEAPVRAEQLVFLSARSAEALDEAKERLRRHLEELPGKDPIDKEGNGSELADIAYTLQVGRKRFPARRAHLCRSLEEAGELLLAKPGERVWEAWEELVDRPVAFLFPGGGAQYAGMGEDLYRQEPAFRDEVDRCAQILRGRLGYDVRELLFPTEERAEEAARRMTRTSFALPVLFTVEYALAKLWISWGVRPEAMIGHSLGEYVAAALAEVFSLEDALTLVTLRGQLFERLPEGGMLSMPLSEPEARAFFERVDEPLSLAAVNGPTQCVASGTRAALAALAEVLTEEEVEFRHIQIDVAAHSELVEPILGEFGRLLRSLPLEPPKIPFLSNVTGTWITPAEAVDAGYWVRQLRQTVRFGEGVAALLEEPERILLEVGPGRNLSTLAQLQAGPGRDAKTVAYSSLRHPFDQIADDTFLLSTLGRLWVAGVRIDWQRFHRSARRRRALPSYPFQRGRFWIDPKPAQAAPVEGKVPDMEDWFYLPSWKRSPLAPEATAEALAAVKGHWLMVGDGGGAAARLEQRLMDVGVQVLRMPWASEDGEGQGARRARSTEAWSRRLEALGAGEEHINIVHLACLDSGEEGRGDGAEVRERGFYSLLYLLQALGQRPGGASLWVVADGLFPVESGDPCDPHKATLLGPCLVAPQEMENVDCRILDLGEARAGEVAEKILREICSGGEESPRRLALRGRHRWVPSFEPFPLGSEAPSRRPLREEGVYFLTGGLGGVGLHLAGFLAQEHRARLVLLGRSALPPRQAWETWLEERGEEDPTSLRLRRLLALEEAGAEVLVVTGDVSRREDFERALEEAEERFGEVHGVVHLAGRSGEDTVRLIPQLDRAEAEAQFEPKVDGVEALASVLEGRQLDFCLLFSSNVSVLGGIGGAAYAAANAFLDATAALHSGETTPWISANWDGWLQGDATQLGSVASGIDRYAMTPAESREAFSRVVEKAPVGQMVVSTGDLPSRLALWLGGDGGDEPWGESVASQPRPELGTAFVPPGDEKEEAVARIWGGLLGLEELGVDDNFFELGGNSLIGLKVIGAVKAELGHEISVVKLFEKPTVRAFAELLGGEGEEASYEQSQSRGARRRERRRRRRAKEAVEA